MARNSLRSPLVALVALGLGCSEYKLTGDDGTEGGGETDSASDGDGGSGGDIPGACDESSWPAVEVGVGDVCGEAPEGGFEPIVEWDYGAGGGCLSLPVVGDLDGDGLPEIVMNLTDLFGGAGDLVALHGDGSGVLWSVSASLGYGSPPALADLDDDGSPEIVVVREYSSSLFGDGEYSAVLYDADGNEVWESEHVTGADFDYASAPAISDMDHDGSPEIVIGRTILTADGEFRGVGELGRGSYGITDVFGIVISEASVPAIADLDLDGQEEVIVGNAMYDADGNAVWSDPSGDDAMIAVANLDSDPEGEVVAISWNTVRALDTDGTLMWGPDTLPSANIVSTPAIADLDLDGMPEIVVAGGNGLTVLNHDGSLLWQASVTDESGATGASIFDFEGDGLPEVVYIDEVEMIAYDGATGAVKFYSTEHASNTMFDYPVIADVDGDDEAEIVVCHNGYDTALSVYGDKEGRWATARQVWNQHAYSISNINDDLTVPVDATPGFSDTNTWHSAIATTGEELVHDLESEIFEVCDDECTGGTGDIYVTVGVLNRSDEVVEAGVNFALYARFGDEDRLVFARATDAAIDGGWSTDGVVLTIDGADVAGADALVLVADDNGYGTGVLSECSETNNSFWFSGPFCE